MLQVIELDNRPGSTFDADESRMITLANEPADVMLPRTKEVLELLGLGNLRMNPVYNSNLPKHLPTGFFPHPQHLLAAMKQKMSPAAYSALCVRLHAEYGDTLASYLSGKLDNGNVKHDPTNLSGWAQRVVDQPNGMINVYQRSAVLARFRTGEGTIYNLPARDGRKPLVDAGYTPAGLYEQILMFHFFKDINPKIIEVDPYIVHPGDKVRDDDGDWSRVSGCWEFCGRAKCRAVWDDDALPYDSLLALL